MNRAGGYISLHRQIQDWEWYQDVNTFKLFVHLLLVANFADTRFLGKKIKRGQIVTSLASLSKETGLSVQEVKTSLKHLISTNEVTNVSTRQYRIITVVKYDQYQTSTNVLTNEQQTTNKQLTNDQQHHNKNNNANKLINKSREFTPPTLQEVLSYVAERGNKIDGEYFFYYYEANGWNMKNWKAKILTWEKREEKYKDGSAGKTGASGLSTGTDGSSRPDYSFLRDTVIQV